MEFIYTDEPNPTYSPYRSFVRQCYLCHNSTVISFTPEEKDRLDRWSWGEGLVQDMFPELSTNEREILISGTHGDCFDKAFAEPEYVNCDCGEISNLDELAMDLGRELDDFGVFTGNYIHTLTRCWSII